MFQRSGTIKDLFHVAGDSRLSDTIASRPDDCDTVFVDYAPDVFMPLVNLVV